MAARALLCLLAVVAGTLAQGNSSCLVTPQEAYCTDYQMPSQMIASGISMVCGMMSNMPGAPLIHEHL